MMMMMMMMMLMLMFMLMLMLMLMLMMCFYSFNGFPSVPYIISTRTDRRQVSGEICRMFGSATVRFPSDESGTNAGELLPTHSNTMAMVCLKVERLNGWIFDTHTSLFHHAVYCLRLKNCYLPSTWSYLLSGYQVLISIDAQRTFLMTYYFSVRVMRKCAIISSKTWQLGAGEPGFPGLTAVKRLCKRNKELRSSNSSAYYHHNHGFLLRTRYFQNWQWEDLNSWW